MPRKQPPARGGPSPDQQHGVADPEQYQRFLNAARDLGCDEEEAAFDEKLKVIARQKLKDQPKPTPKGGPKKGEGKDG